MAGPELETKCPRCGATVAVKDGECPECGEEISYATAILLGVIVALVGLAASWFIHPVALVVAALGLLYATYSLYLSRQIQR